jgi:catechol 2,3-dioxygenase-like lactoylglutathione lyase family enzyme
MIGYVMVGTNDLARSQKFFDAVFGEIGAKRAYETDRMTGWSAGPRTPTIMAVKPYDESPASVGNGSMIALAVGSPDDVKKIHGKATSLGGKDEGAPGFRPAEANAGFYGGYFRDLDGNKFVAFCMVPKK